MIAAGRSATVRPVLTAAAATAEVPAAATVAVLSDIRANPAGNLALQLNDSGIDLILGKERGVPGHGNEVDPGRMHVDQRHRKKEGNRDQEAETCRSSRSSLMGIEGEVGWVSNRVEIGGNTTCTRRNSPGEMQIEVIVRGEDQETTP